MSEQLAQVRIRTVSAYIYGRVQGVGFRWNCQHEAEHLALVGEIHNRADDSVYVIVQDSADGVARLIVWLYKGPKWASVEDVLVEDLPAGSYMGGTFSIRGWNVALPRAVGRAWTRRVSDSKAHLKVQPLRASLPARLSLATL